MDVAASSFSAFPWVGERAGATGPAVVPRRAHSSSAVRHAVYGQHAGLRRAPADSRSAFFRSVRKTVAFGTTESRSRKCRRHVYLCLRWGGRVAEGGGLL